MANSADNSPGLPWADRDSPLRCALMSPSHPLLSEELVDPIRKTIGEHAELVFEDLVGDRTSELIAANPDIVMVLGGDGSILRSARCMGASQIPVVGINLGRLGFLADITVARFPIAMQALVAGECRLINHLMFDCQIYRDEQLISTTLGLNETAILGGAPFSILDVDLFIDGELATSYSCDGLIVSTPVGSTAHNLSAGGPIVRKDVQCFVVSAVSPHTLTVRPVVDTAERVFDMKVHKPRDSTSVVVDGQVVHQISEQDRIRVLRAEPQFTMIEIPGHSYYKTLREKLGWGGRIASKKSKR